MSRLQRLLAGFGPSVLPRRARSIVGGLVHHILNRANTSLTRFCKPVYHEAFERVLEVAFE